MISRSGPLLSKKRTPSGVQSRTAIRLESSPFATESCIRVARLFVNPPVENALGASSRTISTVTNDWAVCLAWTSAWSCSSREDSQTSAPPSATMATMLTHANVTVSE